MKSKKGQLWFPLWIDKWIFGSTRLELDPEERSVWVDLMALSYKDGGFIRANEGCPYQIKQLAGLLVVSEELLEKTIKKCAEVGKLKIEQDGTLSIPSFETYKLSDRQTRRYENVSAKTDTMSEIKDTIHRTEHNRTEQKHKQKMASPKFENSENQTKKDEIMVDQLKANLAVQFTPKKNNSENEITQLRAETIVDHFKTKYGKGMNYGIVKNMLTGKRGYETLDLNYLIQTIDQMPGDLTDPIARFCDMAKNPQEYAKI